MTTFFFVILPYLALAIFVVGHAWRYRVDQFGWTTRTSQVLEKRWLAWGSPLFHIGALLAILGHIAGLLIPEEWTRALGIDDHLYHAVAVAAGTVAGVLVCVGMALLIARRFLLSARIRVVTTPMDYVLYALLAAEVALGMWMTVGINVFGSGYEYRGSIAVWFRSVLTFQPDPSVLAGAPPSYLIHAVLACALVAIWPFTRLVHVWSVPIGYLTRPLLVYRRGRTARRQGGPARMRR